MEGIPPLVATVGTVEKRKVEARNLLLFGVARKNRVDEVKASKTEIFFLFTLTVELCVYNYPE